MDRRPVWLIITAGVNTGLNVRDTMLLSTSLLPPRRNVAMKAVAHAGAALLKGRDGECRGYNLDALDPCVPAGSATRAGKCQAPRGCIVLKRWVSRI
jgi:hypothetical protein